MKIETSSMMRTALFGSRASPCPLVLDQIKPGENQEKLEDSLAEVKRLYEQKYGESVDNDKEDFEYDDDGTLWIKSVTVPARPVQEKLEVMLAEVKDLYEQKYGKSVDSDGEDFEYD
eukprot:TRINITY_DN717_c0_g1_i6.p2 TRINITY_DN717_c0_g1~~TRINITY_DN717_c0_g1_i6.p2  ORF type:complete len:117 (-),score=27.82 TRINITY_DN717_c0_g1_i6:154-504(-)